MITRPPLPALPASNAAEGGDEGLAGAGKVGAEGNRLALAPRANDAERSAGGDAQRFPQLADRGEAIGRPHRQRLGEDGLDLVGDLQTEEARSRAV